jgi:hypothetical protein
VPKVEVKLVTVQPIESVVVTFTAEEAKKLVGTYYRPACISGGTSSVLWPVIEAMRDALRDRK